MIEALSRPVLRVLRVPAEPRLPAGAPGTARVFRAAPNFWWLQLLGWGFKQAVTLAGFIVFFVVVDAAAADQLPWARRGPPFLRDLPLVGMRVVETFAWGAWLVQLPITFALLRLDYELRWYIVTDRAARLREGILTLREMTFSLANVQDVRIQQGPLQRLLGLSDLELRTAGGAEGGAGAQGPGAEGRENLHLARFRGLTDASLIRDLVVDRMKKARGAGLGDPDDAAASPAPHPHDLEDAAREVARESARLRQAVCGGDGAERGAIA